jgi:pimeloyl-ACP methyl ester carboxylesterase
MHARPPVGKLPSAALDQLIAQTVVDAPSEPAYGDTDYDDAGNYSTLARADYSPVAWNVYYDTRFQVTCPTRAATFQCYFNYPKDLKPVEPVAIPAVGTDRPVLVLVHGAGHSALSFALCARVLAEAGHPVLAFDQRAHGGSIAEDESSAAFSCESLVADAVAVLGQVFTAQHVLVLVGHSMGGALVVRIARACQTSSIGGVVVVDVVEGTAMAALEHMRGIIQSRPARFESVTKVPSHLSRNVFNASVHSHVCSDRQLSGCIALKAFVMWLRREFPLRRNSKRIR